MEDFPAEVTCQKGVCSLTVLALRVALLLAKLTSQRHAHRLYINYIYIMYAGSEILLAIDKASIKCTTLQRWRGEGAILHPSLL